MPNFKFLTRGASGLVLDEAIATGGTAAQGDKIVRTSAGGRLDASLMALGPYKTILIGSTGIAIIPQAQAAPPTAGTAIGERAGLAVTTAVGWTAIGANSGSGATTGSYWSAIGAGAGVANTTGNYWTAIGTSAGLNNLYSSQWTAVGSLAGLNNVYGSNWTAVGSSAGGANTDGSNWTAVGSSAGAANTLGSNWAAIGLYSAVNSTEGGDFVAIGYGSAYSETTGSGFVAIGSFAGFYEPPGIGNWLAIEGGFAAEPLIGGNFTNRNLGFNSRNYGGGSGVFSMPEVITAPPTNPASGAAVYVQGGHLLIRSSGGVAQLSPLKASKICAGTNPETIAVSGAAVGDVAVTSRGVTATVTAAGVVSFNGTGLAGLNLNCAVIKF